MGCDIRIGTSGWHYTYWKGRYYPEKCSPAQMFEIYRNDFDTVEINNTFYHLPPATAFENWKRSTPSGFLFALKGSRFITHMKKLKDPEPAIERFFEGPVLLGRKLGPIIFQLPPRWRANAERLDAFCRALPRRRRYAFELRDPSWIVPEILDILRKHRMAFCIYDFAGFRSPLEITTDFAYVRLHGPTVRKYEGSYSAKQLREWARWIEKQSRTLKGIYFYFDNDQEAHAAYNALELKRLVGV
jgi:uncharacterized protein YecE (DUF72 family)